MGIEVVMPVSAADRDQQWLEDVDIVVPIGGARASESYLDQDALIELALHTGATAVHPGWGFLAENHAFATRVESAGLRFIGPSPKHILQMGDKARARATMTALGLDPIPGSGGALPDLAAARAEAERQGYPVLIKAVSGGGGRGMRAVDTPDQLEDAWRDARAEAASAFGDPSLYMEKRILRGRHVEVQILADNWGNCIHLGERECSLQRRHQKVVEEAISPGLSPEERARILPLVAATVAKTGYIGAGTVEMLVDQDGRAWFMEMNTRLQVEHTVSEMLTGIDLVEWQLRIAANEQLTIQQDDVQLTGHAIEARVNAEDPSDDFRPSPGRVTRLSFPEGEGIRVDTHLREGDKIPPHYDSMIAKVIAHGDTREQAIERLKQALANTHVEGVKTNIRLHQEILEWDAFLSGDYNTTSLETKLKGA